MKALKRLLLLFIIYHPITSFTQDVVINEVMSDNKHTLKDRDGAYSDWIELYNTTDKSINLKGYKLTDDLDDFQKWVFPTVILQPHDYLVIFASGKDIKIPSELHTSFKINASGENLLLIDPDYNIINIVTTPHLNNDKTFGRLNDGNENLGTLSNPTPNQSNNDEFFIKEITFSKIQGFYKSPFYLDISCEDSVYYTLDGSVPTTNSTLYTEPIYVSSDYKNSISLIPTTFLPYNPNEWPNNEFGFQIPKENLVKARIIRARSFTRGVASSRVYSQTYFTNDNTYSLPVVSLITDSLNLFDYDSGLYIPGKTHDENNKHWTGNYYQRGIEWEKNASITLFNKSSEIAFAENVGIRITGNKSRSAPQKSIRVYFRDEYGASSVNYPFFPTREYSTHKRFILRSSFTYWGGKNSLYQDDIIHTIVADNNIDLEYQLTYPTILFLNGEYWGVHNIREREDEHYLHALHGIDKEAVNIIGDNFLVEEGSAQSYIDLIAYVKTHDLSISTNYEHVKNEIDLLNFIDYNIIEIYFGNLDWPNNNVELWKPQTSGSKWRWLLYDLDATGSSASTNTFEHIRNASGNHAVLFTGLMENEAFKKLFLERFVYHLRTTFNPKRILEISAKFRNKYIPEVEEHIGRWGNPANYQKWEYACNYFDNFIEDRPCMMKRILIDEFGHGYLDKFDCDYPSSYFEDGEKVKVYPNPSAGNITILCNHKEDLNGYLTIVNEIGQQVYSSDFKLNQTQLDLSFLDNGLYLVYIRDRDFQETKKIVIHR